MQVVLKSGLKGWCIGALFGVAAMVGVIWAVGASDTPFPFLWADAGRNGRVKASAANRASLLARNCHAYCFLSGETRSIRSAAAGNDVASFAVFLAQNTGMNAPDMWFIKEDPALRKVDTWLIRVADLSDPEAAVIDPGFERAHPKSFAVVVDMPDPASLEARSAHYPVVWTRGLGAKGWKKDSPWEGEGGHVAYLDGHVMWYESTVDDNGVGVFKDYLTGEPTSDIRKAIGPGAKVLEDE